MSFDQKFPTRACVLHASHLIIFFAKRKKCIYGLILHKNFRYPRKEHPVEIGAEQMENYEESTWKPSWPGLCFRDSEFHGLLGASFL